MSNNIKNNEVKYKNYNKTYRYICILALIVFYGISFYLIFK